jgi:hypothetical protein
MHGFAWLNLLLLKTRPFGVFLMRFLSRKKHRNTTDTIRNVSGISTGRQVWQKGSSVLFQQQ